jgi:hypothetical protein
MATQLIQFAANDGKKFDNEAAADRHNLGIKHADELTAYANSLPTRAESERGEAISRSRIRNTILDFLFWRETGLTTDAGAEDEVQS